MNIDDEFDDWYNENVGDFAVKPLSYHIAHQAFLAGQNSRPTPAPADLCETCANYQSCPGEMLVPKGWECAKRWVLPCRNQK